MSAGLFIAVYGCVPYAAATCELSGLLQTASLTSDQAQSVFEPVQAFLELGIAVAVCQPYVVV